MNNSSKETIHFFMTGGTIDSYYNGAADTTETLSESVIPSYIQTLKLPYNIEFTKICMKDSRALTAEDLNKLLKAIEETPHKRIVVTHGTYTMPDTARFLEANMAGKDKKSIILTGSMIPLVGFSPSDAPFNLGFSIAQILSAEPGVKVAMNGRLFNPQEVLKVIKEGRFDSIFNK